VANVVIFATSNRTERLSKPLLGRFTVLEIPEYTYPEFEGISTRFNKLPRSTVIQIASSVWKTGSRDIRYILKIAKLCNPSDGEEDITRLISIHQRYRKTLVTTISLHIKQQFSDLKLQYRAKWGSLQDI
jgi:ATP-dependent Lon protease